MPHHLNIVLVEPRIPANTGSIGRVCLATGATLHLVDPLGFEITHSRLKRAGLDYWQHLKVVRHTALKPFLDALPPRTPKVFFTTKSKIPLFQHRFEPGSYLFFGCETSGLPEELLNAHPGQTYCLPQYDSRVRSLNLANVVSVAIYEAIRQLGV